MVETLESAQICNDLETFNDLLRVSQRGLIKRYV